MSDPSDSGLSNNDGHLLVRRLLRPRLPHDLHDYIIEGLCKAVDGIHVLLIVKTGGGKTGLFYGYILLLHALRDLGPSCPPLKRKFPKNPVIIVVYPTKGLEVEMEETFLKLGIKALAINEDTLAAARARQENLWDKAVLEVSMLLLSPEQLSSRSFDHLLQKKAFSERIAALGLDEMHLVLDWGNAGFREAFRLIGLILARLPRGTTLLGATATLLANQTQPLISSLGLKPGTFFFNRRSNLRTDVAIIFRVLRHGLGGWKFPDLKWVVEGDRKVIIYCDTISLAFRLLVYLWHSLPESHVPRISQIHLYCSICLPSYNNRTHQLFINNPNPRILIATDSLKVGNNFPNVADVVVLNPKDPNDIVQKTGRAGRVRRLVSNPRGIVYVTKAQVECAKSVMDGGNVQKRKKSTRKAEDEKMSTEMARIISASCYTSALNSLYDNPENEPPCLCESCALAPEHSGTCICSGADCNPEPTLPPPPRPRAQPNPVPMADRLTDEMRRLGEKKLTEFRWALWDRTQDISLEYSPPSAFLPDSIIKEILNGFNRISSIDDVASFVQSVKALNGHHEALFVVFTGLQETFSKMRQVQRSSAPRAHQNTSTSSISTGTTSTSPVTIFPPTAYDNFFSMYHQPNQIPSEPLVQDNESASHVPDTQLVVNTLNTLQNVANAARRSHPLKRKDPPTDGPRRSKRSKENTH